VPDEYPIIARFRELDFPGTTAKDLDPLTNAIELLLASPWERARDVEQAPIFRGEYRVFRRLPEDQHPGLLLHLVVAADSVIYVPNIVPTEKAELGIEEYNEALVDFHHRFALAAATSLGFSVRLGDDKIDLQSDLSKEVFAALVAFSRGSNRSTGSSHPMDRERWFKFLLLLHRASLELPTWVLQEWLELDGWSESVATELAIEYEFAMGLLSYAEPD
jgi:hypothetical protein